MSKACYKGRCAHCPFNFKENEEGAQFDDNFTVENHVSHWTNPEATWPCHLDIHAKTPCRGAILHQAGRSDVTKQELIDFWVHQEGWPPEKGYDAALQAIALLEDQLPQDTLVDLVEPSTACICDHVVPQCSRILRKAGIPHEILTVHQLQDSSLIRRGSAYWPENLKERDNWNHEDEAVHCCLAFQDTIVDPTYIQFNPDADAFHIAARSTTLRQWKKYRIFTPTQGMHVKSEIHDSWDILRNNCLHLHAA